jgi:hypothetical protein
MRARSGRDLVICGLAGGDVRSLTSHLASAAIAATADPSNGRVVISRSRNRVFGIDDVVAVIGEWAAADPRREARVGVGGDVSRPGKRAA